MPIIELLFLRILPALPLAFGFARSYPVECFSSGTYMSTTTANLEYILSRVLGMHVRTPNDDSSEPLPLSRGGRFSLKKIEEVNPVLTGQAIVLAFLTLQCFGAVIKMCRRIVQGEDYLILADSETFWIGLSGLCVVGCSWAALLKNERWEYRDTNLRTPSQRILYGDLFVNLMTTIIYCTLFSITAHSQQDLSKPLWEVGFFHSVGYTPYSVGSNAVVSNWVVQKRHIVGKGIPSLLSTILAVLTSTLLYRPDNIHAQRLAVVLGILCLTCYAFYPIFQIIRASPYDRPLFYAPPRTSNYKPSIVTIVSPIMVAIGMLLRIRQFGALIDSLRKPLRLMFLFSIWYDASVLGIIICCAVEDQVSGLKGRLGNQIPAEWPCPALWQDPLSFQRFSQVRTRGYAPVVHQWLSEFVTQCWLSMHYSSMDI